MSGRPILAGLSVVEVSAFVAAPLGGATLVELGADVVRVDPPGGGIDYGRWPLNERGVSLYWAGLNQGKRSVNLDTRSAEGQRLLADLVVHAGTCVTNLPVAPWLRYEALAARRPDLVMVVITGNPDGSTAVDYTVNAALGFPWVTGPEGARGPVNHVLPAWDVIAGQTAATAVCAAELHRLRTGRGQLVTLSLADVGLSTASHLGLLSEARLVAEPRGRYGNDLYGSYAHDFATADGRYVMIVALTARQWRSLTEATGTTDRFAALERARGVDLREEGARFAHRAEITALLAPWFAARPLADARRALDEHGVLWGPYQTFQQLAAEDPRASAANPLFGEVEHPGIGRVLAAGSPLVFGDAPRVPPGPAPRMGGDTRSVLGSWLGLDDAALDGLAARHVIPGRGAAS